MCVVHSKIELNQVIQDKDIYIINVQIVKKKPLAYCVCCFVFIRGQTSKSRAVFLFSLFGLFKQKLNQKKLKFETPPERYIKSK